VLNLVAAVIADWFLAHASWSDPIIHLVSRFGPGAAEGFKFYLPLILFALLFRLTWVTGYHAAEHQVVHAIEAGDDLLPEVVRRKPRVHPRCGTNLVVAVFLMSAFWNWRSGPLGDMAVVVAMLCTFFLWRRIGAVVQQYITTRPANRRQIESGILAGEQLMERYQDWPYGPQTGWQRIWNMGLLQVFGGFMLVLGLLFLLQFAHVPLPEITL
jgi:hypothetical protein